MNELLQKYGCSNVFTVPEGLKELMADITREVLRAQPENILHFIANYLSVLLISREHGVLAVRILDDLCDCRPSVSEHLIRLGLENNQAKTMSEIIKEEIENVEPMDGTETVRESQIIKRILMRNVLDEDMTANVCQVIRNAYREYWYRKKLLEEDLKSKPTEPWEIAAKHTLELYKKTRPSLSELHRATIKIQAAYRGYHVRRNLLKHLKPKVKKRQQPKFELPGPPLDIAGSREIHLGPVINIKIREDDVKAMFDEEVEETLGLQYDPTRTLTHIEDEEFLEERMVPVTSQISKVKSRVVGLQSAKSMTSRFEMQASQSKQSRMDAALPKQSRMDQLAEAGAPSTKSMTATRPSQLPSTKSGLVSQEEEDVPPLSTHKISFAAVPHEVIPTSEESEGYIGEGSTGETMTGETQEIPEDLQSEARTDDGESAPEGDVESAPPSTPATADTTDVEDAADDAATTGEEGEE